MMLKIYLQLLLMIVIWGFSFVAVDISVVYITPLSLALVRFLFVSICFIFIDIIKYFYTKYSEQVDTQKSQTYSSTKRNFLRSNWLLLILASLTGIALFFLAQYSAIQIMGPSLPALFVCLLAPVLISIFALILFKENLNKYKIFGFTIATIGGFLLVTGGDLSVLHPNSPNFLGYFFALLTPVLWSIYSTTSKKLMLKNPKESPMTVIKYTSYIGTIELFIFVLIRGEINNLFLNLSNPLIIIAGLYLGVISYVIGYYIWNHAQMKIDSSKVSSFLYVEPFLTLLFSFLLQRQELISFLNILGGIIVLIAVLVINYR